MNFPLTKNSPVSFLLGPLADSFGVLPGTGFKLSEAGRGEVTLELVDEPKIEAAGASWVFRDADGLEVAIEAQRDEVSVFCAVKSPIVVLNLDFEPDAGAAGLCREQPTLAFDQRGRWLSGCSYPTSAYETREHLCPTMESSSFLRRPEVVPATRICPLP
jgi:hypothetical protein